MIHSVFAIRTAQDFHEKLRADYAELRDNPADSRVGMNCILAAYHIHEWVWARWLKPVSPVHLQGTVIRQKRDFVEWLAAHAPEFELIQDLANGSKHCIPTHPTSELRGWGRGPYGVGPWGAAYLLIDLGEERGTEARYRAALEVLRNVVEFWDDFFADQAIPRPGSS